MFLLNKNKKTPENRLNTNEIKNSPELIDSVSPVRVKKDTFISQGAQIIGNVETAGNILVEGDVSGDMFCGNSIKVEHIGKVNGEIKAQQIIIDGYVEGRIEAKAVSILAQGKMVGDIFSDEFSIEKGGVFIGQSHPLPQDQERIVYAQGRGSVDSDEVDAGGAAE
ncbi:polymer-forming cytoskeletal protein [Brenneria sp. 4F2]|nr:polymer-forming cytoskeletal protein [Brenneria bubanii]